MRTQSWHPAPCLGIKLRKREHAFLPVPCTVHRSKVTVTCLETDCQTHRITSSPPPLFLLGLPLSTLGSPSCWSWTLQSHLMKFFSWDFQCVRATQHLTMVVGNECGSNEHYNFSHVWVERMADIFLSPPKRKYYSRVTCIVCQTVARRGAGEYFSTKQTKVWNTYIV